MDQGTQSKAKSPEISSRKRSAARGAVDGQQRARALCGGRISRVSALSVLAPVGGCGFFAKTLLASKPKKNTQTFGGGLRPMHSPSKS